MYYSIIKKVVMNTTCFTTVLMSTVFAISSFGGAAHAMETMTGDSMAKKDDAMMVKDDDTMMKKEDAMMKNDTMMSPGVDLMFGSRGEDVVVLQTFLESHGFLVIPAGVTKGYFGPLTQVALIKYQASVSIPATGYYGPITRGAIAGMAMKKDDTMMKTDDAMMKKEDTMMKTAQ